MFTDKLVFRFLEVLGIWSLDSATHNYFCLHRPRKWLAGACCAIALLMLFGCKSDREKDFVEGKAVGELMHAQEQMGLYAPLLFSIIDHSRSYYKVSGKKPRTIDDIFPGQTIPLKVPINGVRQVITIDKSSVPFRIVDNNEKSKLTFAFKIGESDWITETVDMNGVE